MLLRLVNPQSRALFPLHCLGFTHGGRTLRRAAYKIILPNAWRRLIYSEKYLLSDRLSPLLFAHFLAVESVVFCRPSLLQLSLYRHLLMSRAVRSCLTSYSFGGSRHLVYIGALKKLCNDPSLIYSQCQEAKEIADSLDMDEVSFVCHFRLSLTFGCCSSLLI